MDALQLDLVLSFLQLQGGNRSTFGTESKNGCRVKPRMKRCAEAESTSAP